MAVTLCKELFPGRKGSDGIERKLKHTRIFEVITDDPNDDDYIAGAGDGVTIPRNGDIHPNNPYAVMVAISADQDDETPYRWIVVCEYDTEMPTSQAREAGGYDASGQSQAGGQGSSSASPGNPLARDDNPLDRPPEWETDWEESQVVAQFSRSGREPDTFDGTIIWPFGSRICNSAGLPFDPPPMKPSGTATVTVSKNYPIGHALLALNAQRDWMNAINQGDWKGLPEGMGRIAGMKLKYSIENGIPFCRITFRIKISDEDWGHDLNLLDHSYVERWADDSLHKIDLPQGSGIFPDTPQRLNGNGIRLDDPALLSHDDVFLRFGVFKFKDFADLEL